MDICESQPLALMGDSSVSPVFTSQVNKSSAGGFLWCLWKSSEHSCKTGYPVWCSPAPASPKRGWAGQECEDQCQPWPQGPWNFGLFYPQGCGEGEWRSTDPGNPGMRILPIEGTGKCSVLRTSIGLLAPGHPHPEPSPTPLFHGPRRLF